MTKVSPAQEVDLAIVMGLDGDQAMAVVGILDSAGLLAHGVAVVGAACAVRWGIEPAVALVRLAEGTPIGSAFSDYELRFGTEEAESELQQLFDDGPDGGTGGPVQRAAWVRLFGEENGP